MSEKLLVPLLLVAVGALLGGVINAMVGRYAAFKEAKGIAASLRAEIDSILFMIKRREYVRNLTEILARLADASHVVTSADVPSIALTQDYFTLFHATASKIGHLGELGGAATQLYILGKGLLEDLSRLREWHEQGRALARDELSVVIREVLDLFQAVDRDGRKLVARLGTYTSRKRRWIGLFP